MEWFLRARFVMFLPEHLPLHVVHEFIVFILTAPHSHSEGRSSYSSQARLSVRQYPVGQRDVVAMYWSDDKRLWFSTWKEGRRP